MRPKINKKCKILFISHEATRTGAPILLLNFLNWLKKNSDIEIEILFKESKGNKGALINEFKTLGNVYSLDNSIIKNVLKVNKSLKSSSLEKITKYL